MHTHQDAVAPPLLFSFSILPISPHTCTRDSSHAHTGFARVSFFRLSMTKTARARSRVAEPGESEATWRRVSLCREIRRRHARALGNEQRGDCGRARARARTYDRSEPRQRRAATTPIFSRTLSVKGEVALDEGWRRGPKATTADRPVT